ncbi:hypothetical protein ACH6EH_12895 [Paenibacillus sp. JSM ZJ436]|uniref:hypothetical protein n=1 Tax=Paenibacillus sp. JSM ZJ436 TaxID=3376190 RepID=UPI0037A3981F
MKKTVSFTAALGLALSLTAGASAAPVQGYTDTVTPASTSGTVTTAEGTSMEPTMTLANEPIIQADEVVLNPTEIINLMKRTYFYDMPNGKVIGALAPQMVDTTGNERQMLWTGEWVEIYTWLGKAWIHMEKM